MKDFAIDINNGGDFTLSTFDLEMTTSNAQYVQQKLWIKFKTFIGELWLNTTLGVPYFESILVKNPDLIYVGSILKELIIEEELIQSLTEFLITDFDSLTRTIHFTWKATLTTGETIGGAV